MLVAVLAGCSEIAEGQPLPRAWSILQLAVGKNARTEYIVGAALGNTVLMAGFVVLALLLSVAVAAKSTKIKKARFAAKMVIAGARLKLPGWLLSPTMFLIQPTIGCALASIASGELVGAAVGATTLLFFALLVTGPVLLVTKYRINLRSQLRADAKQSNVVRLVAGPRNWGLTGIAPWRVAHVGRVVMRYGFETPWFFCVDLGKSAALGACCAAQLTHHGCSQATGWTVFVILFLSLSARLVFQPNSSLLRNTANSLCLGLCVVAMLLLLAQWASNTVAAMLALAAVSVVGLSQIVAMSVAIAYGKAGAIIASKIMRRCTERKKTESGVQEHGSSISSIP